MEVLDQWGLLNYSRGKSALIGVLSVEQRSNLNKQKETDGQDQKNISEIGNIKLSSAGKFLIHKLILTHSSAAVVTCGM